MRYSKKYQVRKPKKTRSKRTSSKKTISKVVKRVIRSEMETKSVNTYSFNQFVNPIIDQLNVNSLIPNNISHGTGNAYRIGNVISIVDATVKFSLSSAALGVGFGPLFFDIYIFKVKSRVPQPPTVTEMARFLEFGNSSLQYLSNPLDGMRNLNPALFTKCIKRRIRLYNPVNTNAYYASAADIQQSRQFTFNITKFFKKKWIYDDNLNTPYNDNLYMAIGCTKCDNTTFANTSTACGDYSTIVDIKYRDA